MSAPSDSPTRDAAVNDIGSNSVRLVIYRLERRAIWTVFNEKVLAGLGARYRPHRSVVGRRRGRHLDRPSNASGRCWTRPIDRGCSWWPPPRCARRATGRTSSRLVKNVHRLRRSCPHRRRRGPIFRPGRAGRGPGRGRCGGRPGRLEPGADPGVKGGLAGCGPYAAFLGAFCAVAGAEGFRPPAGPRPER